MKKSQPNTFAMGFLAAVFCFGFQAAIYANSPADTDNDGVNDYRESKDGTNPNNANSFNPLSKGLVAYYPLDGNAKDESGNGNHGTINGATSSQGFDGIASGAFRFDGVDDYIQIPHSEVQRAFPISISLNFKSNQENPHVNSLLNKYYNSSFNGYRVGLINGKIESWYLANFSQTAFAPLSENVNDGGWRQVVVSVDSSGIKTFVDSNLVSFAAWQGSPTVFSSSNPIFIGFYEPGATVYGTPFFKGDIDDVRIYNRALSAAEVSQLYSEESGEPNMVLVQGGTLPAGSALANQTVSAFHIARFETTWAEWKKVRIWAAANGYDIADVGEGSADDHPVRNSSWYDIVKWLNAKSEMEGLIPVYSVDGQVYKTLEYGEFGSNVVTMNPFSNGYRLPMEAEWEFAARGGSLSQGYIYAGSNNVNEVAVYRENSTNPITVIFDDRGTWPIGTKKPNELGLYDMSGNVYEFCWDQAGNFRRARSGSWLREASCSTIDFRYSLAPHDKNGDYGFRYVRDAIGDMIPVQGGTLPQGSGLAGQVVGDFRIGKYEVTWGEWKSVLPWAFDNGYTDLVGAGVGLQFTTVPITIGQNHVDPSAKISGKLVGPGELSTNPSNSGGRYATAMLDASKALYIRGDASYGGTGNTSYTKVLDDVVELHCVAEGSFVALTSSGLLKSYGNWSGGNLSLNGIKRIATSASGFVALDADGKVYKAGAYQTGSGDGPPSSARISFIFAGGYGGYGAIDNNGNFWVWGYGSQGRTDNKSERAVGVGFEYGNVGVLFGDGSTIGMASSHFTVVSGLEGKENHPVHNVNWFDVVKWCNAKSEMEGLAPVYLSGGNVCKTGQNVPSTSSVANGYRLPLEKEWEWAARGGVSSKGYTYSGSNDVNAVAWYDSNAQSGVSEPGTRAVGLKTANELGIFDMSGNVAEWCLGGYGGFNSQRAGGGNWVTPADSCAVFYRSESPVITRLDWNGFRLARNAAVAIQPVAPIVTTLPTASAIVFGQALSNSTLTGGVAGVNGTTVAGAFAFASPATVPPVGNSTHSVVFTPTDLTNFTTATANVTVSVTKAVPVISSLPTASSITFGQAVSSSLLTGGTANVVGSFAFASPSAKPAAGNSTQQVVFTPSDSGNYTTATANVTVRVLQAVPEVSAWPSASPLKFGQALSSSVLSGGSAGVAGAFAFVNPATVPPLGLTTQPVRFSPADSGNYTTLSSNVTVTVDKAEPVISSLPTASAITEGQSLAASVLTGGSANVAGSFAFAQPGTVPPVGNSTHGVVFSPVDAGNYTVAAGNVTVRVNALPSFSLNVTSTPGGNVTASAAGPHKQGSTVTLTAVPDGGFVFVRWAGNATGTANPLLLTVGGNLSVTAIFTQADPADTNVQEFVGGSLLGVGPSGSVAGGANAVAASPDGGMVSVGDFTGSFQALGQNFTAGASTTRAFTAKHGANGTLQWVVAMGGGTGTTAKAERVAVDAAGNVLVAGTFTGTVNFGPATHTAKGNADVFVARLGSNGTVQWVAAGGGTNSETVNGLLAGAGGEAYVTGGYFGANATFGSLALAAQAGGTSHRDAYLGRISANGTWEWVVGAGGTATDQGRAVAERGAGSLWWGGNFQGSAAVGPQQLTSQGATDIFVAAVDAATGNITSPLRFGGTGEDALTALLSDRVEGFYAAGSYASAMALGSVSLANSGVGDGFVARWQKNAGWTWGAALQGGDDDLATSLAMDAEGRLYAGGYFASESLTAASNTLNNTETFSYDGFVARFTSAGGVKWLRGLRGDNNEYVRGVACVSSGASTGALHVVGYTESALSGDAVSLAAPKGVGDAFFVRMNAASAAPSRTVTVNPSVGGTVSLSPAGPSYAIGTQVALTPVPAAGFGFVRWGGWASGNATPFSFTVNQSVSIDAEFADIGAPLVQITSPSEGMPLPSAKVDFAGRITDNVGVASAAWGLNGVEKGNLTLTQNGSFSVPAVPLVPGDNLFTVVATDAAGNEAVEEVLLVWSPARVFSLPATASVNEGRTLKIPVRLNSEGGVGGFRLQVNFDPAVFSSANFSFTGQAALGESLWTAPSPGRVVLLASLGGGSISSGPQQIGELSLRVRSVPLGGLASAIGVEVLDVSNNLGNPLLDGTGSSGCAVNVRSRSLPADINGNGFVDSGDGALLKTLIAEQDPARPWDVALNDLNATGTLDTGDLTKLLRIVVGFDPKPSPLVQPQAIRTASIRTMSLAPMSVAPSIPAFFLNNGTRTPVEVRVSGDLDDQTLLAEVVLPAMGSALNSLEFELKYPAELLQIAEAQTAEAAPTNAIVNSTFGTGLIRFTAFNNSPWATLGGPVMRVAFTRISGAAAGSARHLITLENLLAFTGGGSDSLEVFQRPAVLGRPMQNWIDGALGQGTNANADSDGDGMTNRQEFLAGTDPNDRGSRLKVDGFLHDPAKGEQTLTWRAKRGVRYRVQSSENLNSWISDNSTELLGNDGDVSFSIKPVGNKTKLFYRLQVVE